MPPRYINPYTDFGFKKLFGEETSKDLLIDFLNAVLPEPHHVVNLSFRPNEQLPENVIDRKAIFDIACIGLNGESFTVKMQEATAEGHAKGHVEGCTEGILDIARCMK